MGSVLKNPPYRNKRPMTSRQANYVRTKKTDRKNSHPERDLQDEAARWTRLTFPDIHFYSDTGSGAFNSEYAKEQHNKQQSAKGLPDMNIFAARRGWHGLCPELKPEGTELKMKRGGRVAKVYKNSKGKIVHRDAAPRQVGDWKDYKIERQAKRHEELKAEGYLAMFVIGIEQYKKLLCWYFEVEYQPPVTNAELF